MGKGIFGGMFDLDGDGNLDVFEQTLEFQAFSMIMDYAKKKKEADELNNNSFSGAFGYDESDLYDEDILADMDDDEREEFLEAAGFDSSDSGW